MGNITETLTLTDFLLARIAEDEADAQDALERGFGGWEWLADHDIHFEARTHITRYHPVRVLAECEAKRRIAEDLHRAETHVAEVGGRHDALYGLRSAARSLAAVYAAHPDFRDEWRP